MKIVVVGLGYVGLSNAVLLAQHNEVIGVDISQERVNAVNARKSPINDAELAQFLTEKDLNLLASTNLEKSLRGTAFVVIATPTNYDEKTNFFDTSNVKAVIEKVIECEPNACIVVKSTIPVGYTESIREHYDTNNVIFSPEFLREGKALHDILYPNRIIVGEKSENAKEFATLLAQGAIKKDVKILFTGAQEAEAIKLFSNTYLAMRVAFFNELDSYALAGGMNSRDIIEGISLDPRIGNYYNNPSFGYGGYCLPKDTRQLLSNYATTPQNLISAIVDSNLTRKDFLANEIIKKNPATVGIYRLTMKQGSDNFRKSAIQGIMKRLKDAGINIIIYEPELHQSTYFGYKVILDLNEFKDNSDVIVANRLADDLNDSVAKVFTRDLYQRS